MYQEEHAMQDLYRITSYHLHAGENRTFRTGSKYQIILVTHGSCRICGDSQTQPCYSSDIIFLKPGETQLLETFTQAAPCFLLCVTVTRKSLALLSDATCSLEEKFQFAPYGTNIIHAEINSFVLIRNILTKLDSLSEEHIELGIELYEKSLFTTFLVMFLRTCVQSDRVHQSRQRKMLILDDVFEYISQHLTEDLSLSTLEKEFFISGEHISREFKKNTGMTLHTYITRLRIDLSKKYLLQDISVRDVCQLCGFSSYNHFFRIFKKECGMTPITYYKEARSGAAGVHQRPY